MPNRIFDPKTGLNLPPRHFNHNEQCADTHRGYFCTVKAGHDGWHVAHFNKEVVHVWLEEARDA